jgi:protein-L-isoaspartate(D-aspartate) O-methyltransferase
MTNPADFLSSPRSTQLRRTMVDCQVRTFDVTDADVLSAFLDIPREPFVSEQVDSLIYSDAALLARGAHTSRRLLVPMVVARAFQEARLTKSDRALDVGGSGGYSAAVVSRLVGSVIALDDDSGFVDKAQRGFSQLGLSNARALKGELSAGLPDEGPFDVIVVNGAIEVRPDALLAQLADGGRLLAVESAQGAGVGSGQMMLWERVGDAFGSRRLFPAAAGPLPDFARKPMFAF